MSHGAERSLERKSLYWKMVLEIRTLQRVLYRPIYSALETSNKGEFKIKNLSQFQRVCSRSDVASKRFDYGPDFSLSFSAPQFSGCLETRGNAGM